MAAPLATLMLTFSRREVHLQLLHGGDVAESETWKMEPPIDREGARDVSRLAFDDLYDLMNYCTHGIDE